MPRRRVRENDIRRLLREYLKLELPSILVESSLDLRSSKEEWLHSRLLKCKPDVLLTPLPSQCSTGPSSTEAIIRDAGLILLNAKFKDVEEFIDRHIGKTHTISGVKGVLSHFVVEPYIPHRPEEEFDLMIHSRRLVNVITFGPHSSPRKSFIEVPIESDVTAAPITEVLLNPFLSGPEGGGYSSASICKMASLICLLYRFFDDLSFTSLEFSPLAILKSPIPDLSQKVPAAAAPSRTRLSKSGDCSKGDGNESSVPFTLRFGPPPSSPPPPPPPNPPAATPLNGSGEESGECGGYSVPLTRPNRSSSTAAKLFGKTEPGSAEPATRLGRSKSISTRGPFAEPVAGDHCGIAMSDLGEQSLSVAVEPAEESDVEEEEVNAETKQELEEDAQQQQPDEKSRVDSLIIPLDISGEADYNAMFYEANKWFSGSTSPNDFFPVLWGLQQYEEEDAVDSIAPSPCSDATLRLTVVNPDARIWFIAAGAGAAMIIADTLVHRGFGHELGNFCEYTGATTEDQTYRLCKIVIDLAMKSGRSGLVLLLVGCIANYTDVSITNKGFVRAIREEKERLCERQVRVIFRRAGPNYHSALHEMQKCSRESGVDIRAFGPEVTLTSAVGMAINYVETFDKSPPKKPVRAPSNMPPQLSMQSHLRQAQTQPPAATTVTTAVAGADRVSTKLVPSIATAAATTTTTAAAGNGTAGLSTKMSPAQNTMFNLPTTPTTAGGAPPLVQPHKSLFPLQSSVSSPGGEFSTTVPVAQPSFAPGNAFGSSPQGTLSLFSPIPQQKQQQHHQQQQQQQQICATKDPQVFLPKTNVSDFSFGVVQPATGAAAAAAPTSTYQKSLFLQNPQQVLLLQQHQQAQAAAVSQLFRSPSNSPSFKPAIPFQAVKQANVAAAAPLTQKISFMNNPQFSSSLFAKSPVMGATTPSGGVVPEFSQVAGDPKNRKNLPIGSLQAQIAAAGIGPLPSDNLKPFTTTTATTAIATTIIGSGGGGGSSGAQVVCVNPSPPMNLVGSGPGSTNGSSGGGGGNNNNVNASSPQDKFFI